MPELCQHLQQQENAENMRRALAAIKNICKKYRYMFRSDDLYREMNYIIENLSSLLLNCLNVSGFFQKLWQKANLLSIPIVCMRTIAAVPADGA